MGEVWCELHMCRCHGRGHGDPGQWGRHQEGNTRNTAIDAARGADTDPGEMRRSGVSGAPGDRGGGDGRMMEDVMCSAPGHHQRQAASVAIKSRQELPSISMFTTLGDDDAAVWEPGVNGICRD